jgi:Ca-activated chloride channel homolog
MRIAALFVASMAVAALVRAQNPPSDKQVPPPPPMAPMAPMNDGQALFHSSLQLVVLNATVADKSGKLITDLPETAFTVFQDGVPQPLTLFRREDVPVSIGIVIDNSGSMRDKRAKVTTAALELVNASNPQDEMFVVNFNDAVYLDQAFTNDTKRLRDALDRIDSRAGTAMRDAVSASIDYVKKKGKTEKKVLLVITDGNDNISEEPLDDLLRKARQQEVLVYSVGLLNDEEPREARKAKQALTALAEASGGMSYYPKDLAQINAIVADLAREIRNQYTLAYAPTNQATDKTFRKINVVVNGHGRLVVRTRNGYYPDSSK